MNGDGWQGRQRAEKVAKRFSQALREQHEMFLACVRNIPDRDERACYTSLMLSRLLFLSFLQKRGMLDNSSRQSFLGDTDYLRHRLAMTQKRYGSNTPGAFYRFFLRRLFHEGLNTRPEERAPDLEEALGHVCYLPGALFAVHPLEEQYDDIQIDDEAFQRLFALFDRFRWTLDGRAASDEDEITPDVLGLLSEKWMSQNRVGVHYTGDDITGYISKNTLIPFLFDSVARAQPGAFGTDGPICSLLRENPDAYLYAAMAHGLREPLPPEIEAGLADVARRERWNQPADSARGLPMESWREVVARRQRCDEVRAKLLAGEITEINDLITCNLDIARFARDVIASRAEPGLLHAFYTALSSVTVLDPTCGSGAFLFAALDVLRPLYHACLDRMRALLTASAHLLAAQRSDLARLNVFEHTLARVSEHPGQEYFVLKSIMTRNLYGVDILEEAGAICQARLLLTLLAHIRHPRDLESLPALDCNIRTGNALVGFTSLDELRQLKAPWLDEPCGGEALLARVERQAREIARVQEDPREARTGPESRADSAARLRLRQQLDALRADLDRCAYGLDARAMPEPAAYANWCGQCRPFHWCVEFHQIMRRGGFDVIIGNPPYIDYKKVNQVYQVRPAHTLACKNLYAYVMERSLSLMHQQARFGMIVPVSAISGERFQSLNELFRSRLLWISTYSNRPAKLFEGVEQRLSVFLAKSAAHPTLYTSPYQHWYETERAHLFSTLLYCRASAWEYTGMPVKSGSPLAERIFARLACQEPFQALLPGSGDFGVWIHDSPTYWVRALPFEPDRGIKSQRSEHYHRLPTRTPEEAALFSALLSSSTFYFFYKLVSNCRDLGQKEWAQFPFARPQPAEANLLIQLGQRLAERLQRTARRRTRQYPGGPVEYEEYYPARAKDILDEIDRVLAHHYGFTDEELDFLVNVDRKYRMGKE